LNFSQAKDRVREQVFSVRTRYKKDVREWKDKKKRFCANDSPNDDLKSEL
jgi:hypothetical protein